MLTLNTDENKTLQFEVTIQGIDHKRLVGRLKFVVEGIEYGFPVEILSDYISVTVPPLDDIIKMGLREDEIIDCKLDVFADGYYLNPWNGQFKIKTPVRMEARMTVDDSVYRPEPFNKEDAEKRIAKSLTVTLKDDNGVQEKKLIEEDEDENPYESVEDDENTKMTPKNMQDEEDQAKDDSNKEMSSMEKVRSTESNFFTKKEILKMFESIVGNKFKKPPLVKKGPVKKKIVEKLTLPKTKEKKKLVEVISKTGKKFMVDKIVAEKLSMMSTSIKKTKKNKVVKEEKIISKNTANNKITDPKILMESVGMKNPTIQKLMLERAEAMGGDEPGAQLEALKRLIGISSQENVIDEMNKIHNTLRHRKGDNG